MRPRTLDHVALWVADRGALAEAAVGRLGLRVIEETDRFTLLGAEARRTAQERFGIERFVADWMRVLRDVAG